MNFGQRTIKGYSQFKIKEMAYSIKNEDLEHIKNGDTIHFINGVVRCRICGKHDKMKWPITLAEIDKMQLFVESFGFNHLECINHIHENTSN